MKQQWVHFTDYILTKHNPGLYEYNTTDMYRDSVFSNLIAHGRIYNTYANGHILFDASGGYIFSGAQKGDEQGAANIGFRFDSLRMLKFSGSYSYQTPALIYDLYDGNNFQWMNHFGKVTMSSASFIYMDAKWHLGIGGEATQIQNLLYFSPAALNSVPQQQYQGALNVLKAHIEKGFNAGKWHLNTKEIFQYVPDGLPLHLPRLVSENSLFYENSLFHHNMLLRVGVDVFYNTAYYAYAYQPVFDQYYLQNDKLIGNYVYLDPFISFKVKTFRIFFKVENITSGLLQTQAFYGYALHYPMPDQVFRFGISWDFWN